MGLSFTIAPGTRQHIHSRVWVLWYSRPKFTVSVPRPSFYRLLRLAGLQWRYLSPPPHGKEPMADSHSYLITWDQDNSAGDSKEIHNNNCGRARTCVKPRRIEKEVEMCATILANKTKCMSTNAKKWEKIVKPYNIYRLLHLWSKNWTLETETLWKPMKNLSHHTYLLCELETSLLMRGIQIGVSTASTICGVKPISLHWCSYTWFCWLGS
jgi:hypothetical protein